MWISIRRTKFFDDCCQHSEELALVMEERCGTPGKPALDVSLDVVFVFILTWRKVLGETVEFCTNMPGWETRQSGYRRNRDCSTNGKDKSQAGLSVRATKQNRIIQASVEMWSVKCGHFIRRKSLFLFIYELYHLSSGFNSQSWHVEQAALASLRNAVSVSSSIKWPKMTFFAGLYEGRLNEKQLKSAMSLKHLAQSRTSVNDRYY